MLKYVLIFKWITFISVDLHKSIWNEK